MKSYFLFYQLCFFVFFFNPLSAQDRIFCDESGFKVDSLKAKYYMLKSVISDVIYYLDGTIFQEKIITKAGYGKTHRYHPNKALQQKIYYDDIRKLNINQQWYPNGQMKREEYFSQEEGEKVISFWDSTGLQLVKDGNGDYTDYWHQNQISEKGTYINGVKDKAWKGWFEDGKLGYEELWEKGELIKGTSYNKEGQMFTYQEFEIRTEPINGFDNFYRFIAKNLKYPKYARRNNIEGLVIINLTIDKQGNFTDMKIIRGLDKECNEECLRVLSLCPPWKPGLKRGQLIETRMTVPMSFKLN